MGWIRDLFGIDDPPSLMQQTKEQMRAALAARELALEDWNKQNPWYADWRSQIEGALDSMGSYSDRYNQISGINDAFQRDTDALYNQTVSPLLGSGIGSYEATQGDLFNRRAEAARKGARILDETNQQNFSDAIAQMSSNLGTSQGGFGSGFAKALGSAFNRYGQESANTLATAETGIERDRTNVDDKVRAARLAAPRQVESFRRTALDSTLAPAEMALAGFDSITSRERSNAPQFA